jgi:hypothetical protein
MQRYFARLALVVGSMLMTALGNIIALAAAVAGNDRAWRVAVSNDQTLNAALNGSEDETISSRAGKAALQDKRWGCVLCKFLDRIDKNHCRRVIEIDEGQRL